ncbi:MAG TPA: DUF488 domain-containing protein [Smithellaceae bacterium]|nr:DUF488 domain-containing protein [Smithellaceae bacterium]
MDKIYLFTIGFAKKNAKIFFTKLKEAEIHKLIDIRLNNISQLAGFAKRDDLKYFLRELCACDYIHLPAFAPTKELLDNYKNKKISWTEYEKHFNELIMVRKVHTLIKASDLQRACLLCSEPTPDKCHRRLVAEYLRKYFDNIEINHL